MLTLQLPYPPTGNHAVKHTRNGGHYLTREAQAYRTVVRTILLKKRPEPPYDAPVRVVCEISPPDRRRRDMDNVWKVVADALTLAGVWRDDFLIQDLRLVRSAAAAPGSVMVTVGLINQQGG